MNLPAGRLGGRDCAAKCVAKPCSKRTCGGRIKKMPLKQGTETPLACLFIYFQGSIDKKDAPKAGDGNRQPLACLYFFKVLIKKMPLKQGTETFIIFLPPYMSQHKKDAPKAGDGNYHWRRKHHTLHIKKMPLKQGTETMKRIYSSSLYRAYKKDAPKAGDGNVKQGVLISLKAYGYKKDAPKAGDGNSGICQGSRWPAL